MTAARYDITIDQGSDFALELIVKESGNPKNFSDDLTDTLERRWGARASFRKTLEDTVSYSLEATVTRNSDGKITLAYSRTNSAATPAGTYYYDLELYQYDLSSDATNPPEEYSVTRLLGGALTLRREVTR